MTYRFMALVALFFSSMDLISQQSKIDSLSYLLKSEKSDTAKVTFRLQISELDDDSLAQSSALTALNISKDIKDQRGMARSYRMLGILSNSKKDFEKTINYFDSALQLFREIGLEPEEVEVEYRKGKVYYYAGREAKAVSSFNKVLSFRRSVGDTVGIINTTTWLSMSSVRDLRKSISYSEDGYELSLLIGDEDLAMMCVNNLGTAYKDMGDPERALFYHEAALELAEKSGNELYKAYFLENIGIISSNMGNYPQALRYYLKAMKVYESQNDLEILNDLQLNIGVVYKKNQEYEKALQAYHKFLKVNIKNADSSDIIDGYQNVGNVFVEMKQFDSAKLYLNRSYKMSIKRNKDCLNGEAGSLGDLYYQMGELDSAKYLLEYELSSIERCELFKNLSPVAFRIGCIYRDLNNPRKAYVYFSKSYDAAMESGYKQDIQHASEALYNWHKENAEVSQALKYLEVFKETTDSLFNQENTRKLAWLEANYQMDQVADSLTQAKEEEARVFNVTIEEQKRRQMLILIVSIAAIFILIALYLYLRKRRELTYQFDISEERSAGFKAVITATEDERKRIAKDLHDGVVQQIAAVKLTLASVEKKIPKEEREEIVKAKNMAEAAAEETRNLSHQMMPKVLIEVGMVPAMEEVINNSLVVNNMKVDFQQHGLKERYENRIEIAVYRIFQELVNNVVKHSGAKEVDVQLMENGSKLMLIVEDDGVGMNKEKNDGIGLSNIKSRLTTIDGKVDYASGETSGTVATIVIPL